MINGGETLKASRRRACRRGDTACGFLCDTWKFYDIDASRSTANELGLAYGEPSLNDSPMLVKALGGDLASTRQQLAVTGPRDYRLSRGLIRASHRIFCGIQDDEALRLSVAGGGLAAAYELARLARAGAPVQVCCEASTRLRDRRDGAGVVLLLRRAGRMGNRETVGA